MYPFGASSRVSHYVRRLNKCAQEGGRSSRPADERSINADE